MMMGRRHGTGATVELTFLIFSFFSWFYIPTTVPPPPLPPLPCNPPHPLLRQGKAPKAPRAVSKAWHIQLRQDKDPSPHIKDPTVWNGLPKASSCTRHRSWSNRQGSTNRPTFTTVAHSQRACFGPLQDPQLLV